MENTSRLLAAVASQPARMGRVTGACAARRAATAEGLCTAALWGFPEKPSEGDGSELQLGQARVPHGPPLEPVCERLLVVAVQPWTPSSTPVHAGTPSVPLLVLSRRQKVGAWGAPRAAEGVLGVSSICITCRAKARVP